MHKLFYTLLLIASFSAFGQDESATKPYNKLAIDLGFGVNKPFDPFSVGYSSGIINLFHTELGARYMITNKFGVKADLGYDKFNPGKSSLEFTSNYLRGSIQGVLNLGNILHFSTFTSRIGLLAHGGFGVSTLSGKDFKLISGADKMVNALIGLTPQLKLSEKVSLFGDLSFISNLKQDRNFDWMSPKIVKSANGGIVTAAIGLTINIGKEAKHADWFADEIKPLPEQDLSATEAKIKIIEDGVKDDDKDGILNLYDIESNTPEGSIVNTKGQRVDPVAAPEVKTEQKVEEVVTDVVKKVEELKSEAATTKPAKELKAKETEKHKKQQANELAGAKSINGMNGLFFTVQVGAYNYAMKVDKHKNLENVYMITMPDGKVRYCSGLFGSDKEAYPLVYKARSVGFADAYLTAYYNGERIPIYKARELLKEQGAGIIDPAVVQKK